MLVDCWIFLLKPLFLTYIYICIFFLYTSHSLSRALNIFHLILPVVRLIPTKSRRDGLEFSTVSTIVIIIVYLSFFFYYFLFSIMISFTFDWLICLPKGVFFLLISQQQHLKKWPMRYLYLYLISMTDDWYIHGIARLKLALTLFFLEGFGDVTSRQCRRRWLRPRPIPNDFSPIPFISFGSLKMPKCVQLVTNSMGL